MSPWKPIPTSDQADLTGSTGTPRSTSERRGRSQRLSSWLMLKRPSGTSIMPARKRSQSARANCIQACSSETSDLSLPSIDCEKPRTPPSTGWRRSTSSSVKRSNSISTTLRRRSAMVASPVSTKRRNVNVSLNLLRSFASNRVEP